MKNLFFTLPTLLIFSFSALNAENYDNQIKEYQKIFSDISQKRLGLENDDMEKIPDPFLPATVAQEDILIDVDGEEEPEAETYTLYAVFVDRIKINNDWYKKGDEIGSFTISKIKSKSAIITNPNETKELKLDKGNENVIISFH